MEIIAEVEPTRSREKLERWIPPLVDIVDWIDVPESPLGVARAHSVAVAHYIQERYGVKAIAHVRTSDVNRVGLRSIVGAAVLLGVARLVALRGDEPRDSMPCSDVSPEEAVTEIRDHGLGLVEPGLLVSARMPREAISSRLEARPSFAFVLNATPERLEEVAGIAKSKGVKVYPYIIVATERNSWLVSRLPPYTPRYTIQKVLGLFEDLRDIVDGIVLSVPADYESLALLAREIHRKL